MRHNAVLPYYGNDVGGNTHSHEVKKRIKLIVIGKSIAHGECLHELEPHPATAEIRTRICGIRHLGIQNRSGVRKFIVRHMMITNNEINTLFLRVGNLLDCLYTAIKHDDKLHAIIGGVVYAFH